MSARFLMLFAACLFWVGAALAQIDINTATQSQLDSLKGIGPSKAKAIVDYRRKNGPFRTVDDLLNVPGIGESTLQGLRRDVVVSGGSSSAPATAPRQEKGRTTVSPPAAPAARPLGADSAPARPAAAPSPATPRSAAPVAKSEVAPVPATPAAPARPAASSRPAADNKPLAPAAPAVPAKPAAPAPAKPLAKPATPAAPNLKPAAPASPVAPAAPAQPAKPARPALPAGAN